jgi:hypothetical protein
MQFVQLKHQIGEEKPKPEKKVLSKDIAYPLISYFVYPKGEKHFSWSYEKQEIYPYNKELENVIHLHVDYERDETSENELGHDEYEKLGKERDEVEKQAKSLLKLDYLNCYRYRLAMRITAENSETEMESTILPFIKCLSYTVPSDRQAFAISATEAKKLNSSSLSNEFLFFPHVEPYRGRSQTGFFVLPKSTVEKFRKLMTDLESKFIRKGAEELTPEIKPNEEVSEEEIAKAWGVKLE